jgi:hypothetical protein
MLVEGTSRKLRSEEAREEKEIREKANLYDQEMYKLFLAKKNGANLICSSIYLYLYSIHFQLQL